MNKIVLVSGGLDSTTLAYMVSAKSISDDKLYALSFHYGQRNSWELECAKHTVAQLNFAGHKILSIDPCTFGDAALTNDAVPKSKSAIENQKVKKKTYVPARNILFLTYALAWAEVLGGAKIFIGCTMGSIHPDTTLEFFKYYEQMARVGVKNAVTIEAPFKTIFSKEIIKIGLKLGVDYRWTCSCYSPVNLVDNEMPVPCKECPACYGRIDAFSELGMTDPLLAI